MSLTGIFDIGKSGLFASQKGLSVTSHNIANVHTPGYARQEAVLAERGPVDGHPGQVGTGVEVAQIRRQVNSFVEQSLLNSRELLGRFDAARSGLLQVAGALAPSTELGIAAGLNDFFQALQDVSTNPADPTARTVLLSKATTLANRLNQTAVEMDRQRVQLDTEIRQRIVEVNALTAKISELNQQIGGAEVSGQQANDLRDQRGRLLGDLANLIDISTIEDQIGQVTVFAGRGQVLVAGAQSFRLVGVPNPGNGGLVDIRYDSGAGPVTDLTSVIDSGRLKGLLDLRDQEIPNALASLDTLTSTLVSQVNARHQAGFGLDGSTNLNFFAPAGTTARDVAVALADGRQVAASSTASGVPGNNLNALALAALQTTSLAALSGATFGGYFGALVSGVGSSAQSAERDLEAQDIVHEQLEARRAEVSGVSLDEELVNMIQQQRAFQAASKVIVTADEMLQTLLSLKR